MGILSEMFDEEENRYSAAPVGELLAQGDYESSREKMLSGYKEFRKKYAVRSLIGRLLVVLLATASAIFMVVTSSSDQRDVPIFCLILCLFIGGWFISQSVSNKKKYMAGVDSLTGIPYHAEIYTDKVKIVDMSPIPEVSQEEQSELTENKEDGVPEKAEENPSTVIHLDEYIVDILDREDVYVLVVRKAYVFIIPKDAFTAEENQKVKEKLSAIMGIRYKK
ncbi:MAG: hypothetical protein J1E40_00265 [Oscillospiraceae bacterium]|nr:hypothetical protein [Oscillospiraceae bacterium]